MTKFNLEIFKQRKMISLIFYLLNGVLLSILTFNILPKFFWAFTLLAIVAWYYASKLITNMNKNESRQKESFESAFVFLKDTLLFILLAFPYFPAIILDLLLDKIGLRIISIIKKKQTPTTRLPIRCPDLSLVSIKIDGEESIEFDIFQGDIFKIMVINMEEFVLKTYNYEITLNSLMNFLIQMEVDKTSNLEPKDLSRNCRNFILKFEYLFRNKKVEISWK